MSDLAFGHQGAEAGTDSVLADEVAHEGAIVNINGYDCITNLPLDFELFDVTAKDAPLNPYSVRLRPYALDDLEEGEYFIASLTDKKFGSVKNRQFTVMGAGDKKKVSGSMFSFTSHVDRHVAGLMASLGYDFPESDSFHLKILNYPTPTALVAGAKKYGVDAVPITDCTPQGYIRGKDYLEAYANKRYPVSVSSEVMYLHDIDDGHYVAVILGGEPLADALAYISNRTNPNDYFQVKGTSISIDKYTDTLRRAAAKFRADPKGRYGGQNGYEELRVYAKQLGMEQQVSDQILEYARARAAALGLDAYEATQTT